MNAANLTVSRGASSSGMRGEGVAHDAASSLPRANVGEWLPRVSASPDGFPCGFCRFRGVCWV